MQDKKENAQPDGNQLGIIEKGADEGSALTVYQERMKKSRQGGKGPPVRVVHPTLGTVVVEGGSKLIAIQNAARVWGKRFIEISRECEVWRLG